jgi:carbonic anhydrase
VRHGRTSSGVGRAAGTAALVILLGAACSAGAPASGTAIPLSSPSQAGTDVPEFGYEGDIGPKSWGRLSPEFALCESGQRQSPIDLADAMPESLPDPELAYATAPVTVTDSGHTMTVAVPEGSTMTLAGTAYALIQFHYHSPAEHPVDGHRAAVEWHFVHRSADGAVAVVAVPVEEGAAAPAWDAVLQAIRDAPPPREPMPLASVDLSGLLPASLGSYRYDGSLTTPPCTEDVRWTILADPLTMTAEQIEIQRDRYDGNARPVADRNERPVIEDQPDP